MTSIALVCVSTAVFALQKPTQFVTSLVSNLQSQVSAKHATLSSNPSELYNVVKKEVMPDIAIEQMAGMTLGPRWRSATAVQKKDFVGQFSQLVTRNYSAGLLKVSVYNFKVYPLRGNSWESASQVDVHGAIVPKNGGQGSNVTYYLERSGDSWKIYDLAIEGVSFVNNFRSQFASYQNLNDLISALKKLNERSK